MVELLNLNSRELYFRAKIRNVILTPVNLSYTIYL